MPSEYFKMVGFIDAELSREKRFLTEYKNVQ